MKKKNPNDTFELGTDFKGWDNKSHISYTTFYHFYENNQLVTQQSSTLTSLQIPKDKKFILDLMTILIKMLENLK